MRERLPNKRFRIWSTGDEMRLRYLSRLNILPTAHLPEFTPDKSALINVSKKLQQHDSSLPRDSSLEFLGGWCM